MAEGKINLHVNTGGSCSHLRFRYQVTQLNRCYATLHQFFVKSLTIVAAPNTPITVTTTHPITVIQTGCR